MSRSTPSLLADATRDLAEFAVRTEYDDIPPAVIERVKLSFIDGLGVCLHGATLPWTQRLISWSIAPAAAGPQRGLRRQGGGACLGQGLSRDIGRHGITVNSIAPGRIMSEQIRRNYPEEERKRFSAAEIPLGAYGEPEDLANLAVFLASPRARYITGTVIPVDGGLRRYSF